MRQAKTRIHIDHREIETDAQQERSRKRKTWTERDCKDIHPITDRQRTVFEGWYQQPDSHLAMVGSPGTGKTYLACFLGINEVLNPETPQKQLIIVRSAVETRQQGFLPGTLEEKEQIYSKPYVDIFHDLFKRPSTFEDMCVSNVVKFMTTSYVRGLTFDNAIIVLDEFQNTTKHELSSVVTRIGRNSRLIICGDGYQNDLHAKKGTETSGFDFGLQVISRLPEFTTVKFTHDDICRSQFVKDWLIACEEVERHR